jgi:NitT/TauT family transport system substrate-binding protein
MLARFAAVFVAFLWFLPAGAETIKIGMVKSAAGGAIYVAQEKGFFAAAGLPAELVFFDSAQPVAVAAVTGDIDFGATGITAAFFTLAGQGALKLISGANLEMPGFQYLGYVISNQAYAAGLKDFANLPGHSFGLTQAGTSLFYSLARAGDKYHFDFKTLRTVPLQSNSNVSSALAGGQIDSSVMPVTPLMKLVLRKEARLLGWVSDVAPGMQANVVFTARKMADERRDTVERFLAAYKKGTQEFHDAFTGPDEKRRDGAAADATLAIIAKYTGQSLGDVRQALPYVDAQARLDSADVLRQIAWYKSQNLLKGDVDGDKIIDRRYVIDLPEKP